MAETIEQIFEREVQQELFRLKVREDARRRYDEERLASLGLPIGVMAGDPISADVDELIPWMVPQHGGALLTGAKNEGKSLTAVEMQHSVLTGTPLWGHILPKRTVTGTIHFMGEHHSYMLQQLIQNKLKFPSGLNMRIFGPEHLGDRRIIVSNGIRRNIAVDTYKKLAEGAGLIVFDPIASFIQGTENAENDNTAMRQLVMSILEVASENGAACLILAHKGKPIFQEGKKMERYTYATRGASAVEDALASILYLSRIGKDGSLYEVEQVHYKGPKADGPFKLHRSKETLRHTLLT